MLTYMDTNFTYTKGMVLGATTDMKFNLYDKNLQLLESIQHEERTMLSLQHDTSTGLILVASAYSLSVWRAYRALNLGELICLSMIIIIVIIIIIVSIINI